jgi:hypothetical protein
MSRNRNERRLNPRPNVVMPVAHTPVTRFGNKEMVEVGAQTKAFKARSTGSPLRNALTSICAALVGSGIL